MCSGSKIVQYPISPPQCVEIVMTIIIITTGNNNNNNPMRAVHMCDYYHKRCTRVGFFNNLSEYLRKRVCVCAVCFIIWYYWYRLLNTHIYNIHAVWHLINSSCCGKLRTNIMCAETCVVLSIHVTINFNDVYG